MKNKYGLPDKPSELIRLALTDLEIIEKKDGYTVDMIAWHHPIHKTCFVCLAGAVMAIEFDVPRMNFKCPDNFDLSTAKKLRAINFLRRGAIHQALLILGIDPPADMDEGRGVMPYKISAYNFKADMVELADYLETFNL